MIREREREILFVSAILILTSTVFVKANAQEEIRINWIVKNNPSFFYDIPFSTCEKDSYIYVIGFDYSIDAGVFQPRIEKRSKNDGSLVKNWTYKLSNYGGVLYDCTVVGEKLYTVGTSFSVSNSNWILLVLDPDLNLINQVNLTRMPGAAISIVSDKDYLYIAGLTLNETAGGICVEKIRVNDLSIVREYVSNTTGFQEAYYIEINPVSDQIWIVGNTNSEKWRIEILDKNLTQIRVMEKEIGTSAISIDFDEEGYSYVVGEGGIIKLSKNGEEIKTYAQRGIFAKTRFLNNRLYVASMESIENYIRQVIYIFDKELNLLNKTILSNGINADAIFLMGRMASDSENLYVSGLAYAGYNDYEWTICSVKVNNVSWYFKNWQVTVICVILILIILIVYFVFRMMKTKLRQTSEVTQPSSIESTQQPSETIQFSHQ
ncbi:MAG: hypothetical protein QXI11_07820 [Thermoproteota archaeon]